MDAAPFTRACVSTNRRRAVADCRRTHAATSGRFSRGPLARTTSRT